MYLIKGLDKQGSKGIFVKLIPDQEILDDLNYQMIVIGFLMLTLGIITGSRRGPLRVGNLLELGPERNMVPDHLAYLCIRHPFQDGQGMARKKYCRFFPS